MPKVEAAPQNYELPEGGLCFGKVGWSPVLEEVVIQINGLSIEEAMTHIWNNHHGLLGEGDIVFKVLDQATLRGYVVFEPDPEPAV